jgi:hypothetical protein
LLTRKNESETKESPKLIATPTEDHSRITEEQSDPYKLKESIKAKAIGTIGSNSDTINYFSPAVRGRIIWGALIPFDNVWVTGAHHATSIDFNQEVEIGGVTIASGKYALFTVPGKEEWTIMINKNWDQHLAYEYDQKLDIVRVKVKPETEETNQERWRYVIEQEGDEQGEIVIYLEKLEVSFKLSIAN